MVFYGQLSLFAQFLHSTALTIGESLCEMITTSLKAWYFLFSEDLGSDFISLGFNPTEFQICVDALEIKYPIVDSLMDCCCVYV